MSNKNIDEQVDKLEEAAEKYASANTVISIVVMSLLLPN